MLIPVWQYLELAEDNDRLRAALVELSQHWFNPEAARAAAAALGRQRWG